MNGWQKSTRSGNAEQNCVEVDASVRGIVRVRDSKDPDGPVLAVARRSWGTFLDALAAGTFDRT